MNGLRKINNWSTHFCLPISNQVSACKNILLFWQDFTNAKFAKSEPDKKLLLYPVPPASCSHRVLDVRVNQIRLFFRMTTNTQYFFENCEHFDLHYITASIGNKLQDDFYQDSYIYLVSSKHKLMDRNFHFIKKVKSLCNTNFEISKTLTRRTF